MVKNIEEEDKAKEENLEESKESVQEEGEQEENNSENSGDYQGSLDDNQILGFVFNIEIHFESFVLKENF